MANAYSSPSFIAAPVATICSKSGCGSQGNGGGGKRVGEAATKKVALSDIVVLPADLSIRADKNLLYVFEPEVQLVFEMNSTASDFLKACDGTRSIEKVTVGLAKSYSKDLSTIQTDVLIFLVELKATGFRILFA